MKMNTKLGFGGGCHWCTEAVFQAIDGVESVEQGYISSTTPYENKSEAVIIHFTDQIDLEKLIDIHLQTHAATKQHSRRNDYRSAIYYFDEELKNRIEVIIISLSQKRKQTYITKVLALESFEPSRESIQNYYQTRPEAPFCKRYIEPKLELVKKLNSSIN
ncbi:MAG: peptide-methionine (S)-S-oxide reductase [Nonlabens sp.]|jgi:peptide-methionine (S)-S-oxide reductase